MISDPHEIKHLKIKNLNIPVFLYGKSGNPPIIFIHGYLRSFSAYIGDLPVRYLMKDYFVVAFDLPGFGYSKKLDMDKLEFISKVQKQILRNKSAVLFGISYGGLLSLEYASLYENKIKAIIIAGTPLFSGLFNIYKLGALTPKYRKMFREFGFLTSENLSKINQPVLLYYNRSDYLANVFMGRKLNKMIPNSKIFESKGLNHRWLTHRIDESGLLSEIHEFLKKSPTKG